MVAGFARTSARVTDAEASHGITITWKPNTDRNLAGYHIYYGPESRVYTNRVTVGRTATTARVEPLVPGGIYYLAVTAFYPRDVESVPSRELIYYGTNMPPVITPIPDQFLKEDFPSGLVHFSVRDTETPDELTVEARSSDPLLISPEYILLEGTDSQRSLVIVPQLERFGSAEITLTVRDPQGASSQTSFRVYVEPVNDEPVISPIGRQVIYEDAPTTMVPFYVFDVDSYSEDLWLLAYSSNPLLIPDENIIITGSGYSRALSFTPAPNAHGSCLIRIYVVDPDAAYRWSEFPVVVRPVNDPPTIGPLNDLVLDEDTSSSMVPVTVFDVDNASTDLVLSAITSDPLLIRPQDVVLQGNDENRFMVITPNPNQFGLSLVRLVVSDPSGASSTNGFAVTVNAVNDPPNLDPISSFSVLEGSAPVTVPLSGINAGASNELQTLVVTATSSRPEIILAPQVNYLSPNTFGSLRITPVANTNGTADIFVSVSDGQPINGSISRSFSVTVQPFNHPPAIHALPQLAVLQAPMPSLQIPFSVLDPDTPSGRLTLSGSSSDASFLPSSNIVFEGSGAHRTVTFTPTPGRTGLLIVTVTASDGETTVSVWFNLVVSSSALR